MTTAPPARPTSGENPWFADRDAWDQWVEDNIGSGSGSGDGLLDVVFASKHGMGDGTTADGTAFRQAIDAALGVFTQTGMDRSVTGIKLKLPGGQWNLTDVLGGTGNQMFFNIVAPATGQGKFIIEGTGHTILKAPLAVTRGTSSVSSTSRTGQTVTVVVGAPIPAGVAVGSPFSIPLFNRGYGVVFDFTVESIAGNRLSFTFKAGATGDDGFKPANATSVEWWEALINPLNFSTAWEFELRDVELQGPGDSRTPDPSNQYPRSIGAGLRVAAHVNTEGVRYTKWSYARVICGTAWGGQGAQNTDHWVSNNDRYQNNRSNRLILDNQTGGGGVGGSRDWVESRINESVPQFASTEVSDGGSLANWNVGVYNCKSMSFPIYGQGIYGVAPRVTLMIENHTAIFFKPETPGNCAWVWDESRMRDLNKISIQFLAMRGAITVNGAAQNDHTWKPWAVTSVSLVGGTMTCTLPAGHQVVKGECIAVAGAAVVAAGIDGYFRVASVSGNVVTGPRPDYTGADVTGPGLNGVAGLMAGVQVGRILGSYIGLLVDVDNTDFMNRVVLDWNIIDAPDCEFHLIQPSDGTGEGRGHGGFGNADLPVFWCTATPGTAPDFANTRRFTVYRGNEVFYPVVHDPADTNVVVAGTPLEYVPGHFGAQVAAGTSIATSVAGVAQQGAPAGTGAFCAVRSSGTGTAARVWVDRQLMLVAQPPSMLIPALDVSGLIYTGSAPSAGQFLVDTGNAGAVSVWDGTTVGQRVIAIAIGVGSGGFVAAQLVAPFLTGVDAAGKMNAINRRTVKTANYPAVAGDLVPCDTTGGAFTVTLPTAPLDDTIISVKLVAQTSTNAVTVQAGGSDIFNKAGGGNTLTISSLNRSVVLQYDHPTGVWTLFAGDTPQGSLVIAESQVTNLTADLAALQAIAAITTAQTAAALVPQGVISGGLVSPSGTAGKVDIAAGRDLLASGSALIVGAATAINCCSNADATNPRWILFEVETGGGTLQANVGAATAQPVIPDLTAGRIAHALAYVPANATTVDTNLTTGTNAKLIELRSFKPFLGADGWSADNNTWTAVVVPTTTAGSTPASPSSSSAGSTVTKTAHGYTTGMAVIASGFANTTGVTNGALYYVIVLTSGTYQLATTAALAAAGTFVPFGGTQDSGTITATGWNQFTVNADASAYLEPSTKLSWVDSGGTKYGVVHTSINNSGTTTVTPIPNSETFGPVANSAITTPRYSLSSKPQGFPSSFAWAGVLFGWLVNPTGAVYRWLTIGKTLFYTITQTGNGTSVSATHTLSLPCVAATVAGIFWETNAIGVDGGAVSTGTVWITSGGQIAVLNSNLLANASSGANRLYMARGSYEFA